MNISNTLDDFFAYAFTQAKTAEQRLALFFVKEGYMLPTHLEKLTWEDLDLINNRFWSFNYLGRFPVPMSSELRQEIQNYTGTSKKELFFKDTTLITPLLQNLNEILEQQPALKKELDGLFIELPKKYYSVKHFPQSKLRHRISGDTSIPVFYITGKNIAQQIQDILNEHSNQSKAHLLDWGCCCGRVAIHLFKNTKINYTGCDIDEECIDWCKNKLSKNQFFVNNFNPPLPFNDSKFTVVFATSVMTHLDENSQQKWLEEIHRVLKPNGLFLATTLGEQSANILGEKEQITKTGYIARTSNVLDGITPKDRYKNTFQNKAYTYENWTEYFDILDYKEQAIGHQDLVIMKRKES